jgi:hypothetical protein
MLSHSSSIAIAAITNGDQVRRTPPVLAFLGHSLKSSARITSAIRI